MEYLIEAAGGNATAIRIIDQAKNDTFYQSEGKTLMEKYEKLGAEQSGFLIKEDQHFQMAGGEFCGNATRVVGILFSELSKTSQVKYTVSGYAGDVTSSVQKISDQKYLVESIFSKMSTEAEQVVLSDATLVCVVDLGGIVHILIEGALPEDYESRHYKIVSELHLDSRSAVGVIWYQKVNGKVRIDPVVWVKSIDTFFYETSCGSGSIAAAKVTDLTEVVQVTGQSIFVNFSDQSTSLKSEMEVVSHENSLLSSQSAVH